MMFLFYYRTYTEDFEKLQYVNFSKLRNLKFLDRYPEPEYVMKFLENNGKNLKKFYTYENNSVLSLSISKFCPNLKSLFVVFNDGELDILKTIFINCQNLESVKIWCGRKYLNKKEVFETVANYSPNSFCELKIYNSPNSYFISSELESFFISWKSRTPKKLLTLIYIKDSNGNCLVNEENMKIIEKYKNLGIIEYEFKVHEEDYEEGSMF